MSPVVLPSPLPLSSSSLVPRVKTTSSGPTSTSQLSLADCTKSAAVNEWYLWLGGQSSAVADGFSTSWGGSVSATTVTCTSSVAVPSTPSSTVRVSVWTPGRRVTVGITPSTVTPTPSASSLDQV